jgi:hypothetical protein
MQEAIAVVRMAANPGEDYEDVAERIEREAAMYRQFLRAPAPIGKITLNAKYVVESARGGDISGRVYQVRDPAEGQAYFVYTFRRSAGLVLEFIVHDQHDVPLFPIVRTYSDWLGKKSFDLGAGRTFELQMSEGSCPGLVRVEASFVTARAASVTFLRPCPAPSGGLPLAAVEGGEDGAKGRTRGGTMWLYLSHPTYRTHLALALGVKFFFLFVLGLTFSRQMPHAPAVETPDAPAVAHAAAVFKAYGGAALGLDDESLAAENEMTPAVWRKVAYETSPAEAAGGGSRRQNESRRAVTRIAAVTGGRVRMDDNFCRHLGALCDRWRDDIQSTLDAVSKLTGNPANATGESGNSQGSAPMLLSYLTEGDDSGHVHVTLLADSALYLVRGMGCMEFDIGSLKGFVDANAPANVAAGSGACGNNGVSEQPEGNNTAAAEKREMTSNAE